jgi:hypothetical protein
VALAVAAAAFSLMGGAVFGQQASATVDVDAEIRGFAVLLMDGTDPDTALTLNEMINFGDVDSLGLPITGAPGGSPGVLGIAGIPVDASGKPLASPDDPSCIGAFYPLFEQTGKNKKERHSDAALTLFIAAFDRFEVWANATLVTSSANVTVGQLKWKPDRKNARGFHGYTPFGSGEQLLESGKKAWDFFYYDIGLLVEHEDGPGANTWMITLSFVSD